MGRRVRRFLIIIPAAAVVLLSLLLATCSNEFDIFEAIKTEMKVANDLFLEILSIDPGKNATEVNPSEPILIEFDRNLDETTMDNGIIVEGGALDPSPVIDPKFDPSTKMLTVKPVPYFEGPNEYTVTINKNLKGTDGNALQEEYIWKFNTRLYPAGSMYFQASDVPYALNHTVDLDVSINSQVTHYRYALVDKGTDAATAFANIVAGSGSDWTTDQISGVEKNFTIVGVNLPTGDGDKVLHFQAMEEAGVNDNIPKSTSDETFLDENDPTVTIDSGPSVVDAGDSAYQDLDATPDDGSGSGFDSSSYSWTVTRLSGSGDLTFTDSDSIDTSVYDNGTGADGTFRLLITVTDLAERTGSTSRDVTWDRIRPTPSISVAMVDPDYTFDTTPTWTWSTSDTDIASFERAIDGGAKVSVPQNSSYTSASSMGYGRHWVTLYATDDDGNSSTVSESVYISPTVIYPFWGEKNVSRSPTFDWPKYSGSYTYYYELYIWRYKIDPVPSTPAVTGLTNDYYKPPRGSELPGGYQINWYFRVYHIVSKNIKIYDYTSDTFTFWTVK
jgi:hypothetical protein